MPAATRQKNHPAFAPLALLCDLCATAFRRPCLRGMPQKNMLPLPSKVLLPFVVLLISFSAQSQSSSMLGDGTDDYIHRSQLNGKVSLASGLTNKSFASNLLALDSLLDWKSKVHLNMPAGTGFNILPVSITTQLNSRHPWGWNDAAMIPARGFQTAVSAGFSFSSKYLSIQLKPEVVYAANTDFKGFADDQPDPYWTQYYRWLNSSDIPEKFGNSSYTKLFPGQSSIRFNIGNISAGVSTENLWWGPGSANALVLGNNAPGFLHGTINTIKPFETNIGTFEAQLIGGKLTGSGILPPGRNRYNSSNQLLYRPKREEDRYIAGFTLTWGPKWVKGLFLGFAKASYQYTSDISGVGDILPLEGIVKTSSEKNNLKASLGSLFARYVMPAEKAELYIEYGRNDKSPNIVNLIADNGYPRAYVAGFRKLFTLRNNSQLEFLAEFTQLQLPTASLVFSGRSWYTDSSVRHGYTNQGQVLGAGIGPGSNVQMLDFSWVKGFNKIGLKFERLLHNNDFDYNAYSNPIDFTRHWVDVGTTLHADLAVKNFLLSSQFALVRSLNYQWYTFIGLRYFENGYDVLNFHGRISVAYRL